MSCSNTYDYQREVPIIRGDRWQGIRFTVSRADDPDYSDATVKWQLRRAADGTILLSKNIDPEEANGTHIIFVVSLTAAETRALNDTVIQSDVQITIPGGSDEDDDVRTPIYLKFRLTKDITK